MMAKTVTIQAGATLGYTGEGAWGNPDEEMPALKDFTAQVVGERDGWLIVDASRFCGVTVPLLRVRKESAR